MMALVARGKHADACELAVRFKLGDDVDCKLFLGPLLLGGGHQAAVQFLISYPGYARWVVETMGSDPRAATQVCLHERMCVYGIRGVRIRG